MDEGENAVELSNMFPSFAFAVVSSLPASLLRSNRLGERGGEERTVKGEKTERKPGRMVTLAAQVGRRSNNGGSLGRPASNGGGKPERSKFSQSIRTIRLGKWATRTAPHRTASYRFVPLRSVIVRVSTAEVRTSHSGWCCKGLGRGRGRATEGGVVRFVAWGRRLAVIEKTDGTLNREGKGPRGRVRAASRWCHYLFTEPPCLEGRPVRRMHSGILDAREIPAYVASARTPRPSSSNFFHPSG